MLRCRCTTWLDIKELDMKEVKSGEMRIIKTWTSW